MPQVNWEQIRNGSNHTKRYSGANVKFFNAYNENREKSLAAGRPIFDEIPSISIQWPGGDETVRKIEPQDMQEYPEKYAAFKAGQEPVESGTPLSEWTLMNGATLRELQYLGFKTVEQLADASDEMKRKLGPTGQFIKKAQDWLAAANCTQSDVVALRQQLEHEKTRTARLESQVELLMQRIEGNEGTDLRPMRREVIRSVEAVDVASDVVDEVFDDEPLDEAPKRRGRPRKV